MWHSSFFYPLLIHRGNLFQLVSWAYLSYFSQLRENKFQINMVDSHHTNISTISPAINLSLFPVILFCGFYYCHPLSETPSLAGVTALHHTQLATPYNNYVPKLYTIIDAQQQPHHFYLTMNYHVPLLTTTRRVVKV